MEKITPVGRHGLTAQSSNIKSRFATPSLIQITQGRRIAFEAATAVWKDDSEREHVEPDNSVVTITNGMSTDQELVDSGGKRLRSPLGTKEAIHYSKGAKNTPGEESLARPKTLQAACINCVLVLVTLGVTLS